MATNYYNVEMGVVDSSGNVNVIYPVTTAANVAVASGETLASRLSTINSNISTLNGKSDKSYVLNNSSITISSAGGGGTFTTQKTMTVKTLTIVLLYYVKLSATWSGSVYLTFATGSNAYSKAFMIMDNSKTEMEGWYPIVLTSAPMSLYLVTVNGTSSSLSRTCTLRVIGVY